MMPHCGQPKGTGRRYLVVHEGHFAKLEQGYIAENCQLITAFAGAEYHYPVQLEVYSCK